MEQATKIETISTAIRESYEDARCPDCGLTVPFNVQEGENCEDCGYIFNVYRPTDDTPATTGVQAECEFVTTWGKCDRRAETGKLYCIDHEHDMKTANRRRQASTPTTGVHTATPWHVTEYEFICAGIETVADLNYTELPKEVRRANAAFIVKAVNAHDQLVAALIQARNVLYVEDEATAKAVKMIIAALTEVEK